MSIAMHIPQGWSVWPDLPADVIERRLRKEQGIESRSRKIAQLRYEISLGLEAPQRQAEIDRLEKAITNLQQGLAP